MMAVSRNAFKTCGDWRVNNSCLPRASAMSLSNHAVLIGSVWSRSRRLRKVIMNWLMALLFFQEPTVRQPFLGALDPFAGRWCSLPNPHAVDFDDKEFAVIKFLIPMAVKKGNEPFHQLRNNLGVVMQLNGHDADVLRWGISHDVGKIAVE